MIAVKKIVNIPLFLLLISCANSTKPSAPNPAMAIEVEATLQPLLAKFKEISVDTFKIISSLDFDEDNYRFKGVLMDSSDVRFLPAEIAKTYYTDKKFYACYQFKLTDTHIGLIIRTPSMYTPTSIKLFVVDVVKNKIIEPYIELAETVIQLVEYWDKKTWIVKDKKTETTFLMWEHKNEDTTEIFYKIRFTKNKFDTLIMTQK